MRHLRLFVVTIAFSVLSSISALAFVERKHDESTTPHAALSMPLPSREIPGTREFFNRLIDQEPFPAWNRSVPIWQQAVWNLYRLGGAVELSGFARSEDCGVAEFSAEIRREEVLPELFSPEKLQLQITDGLLTLLQEAGVPEEVLDDLEQMKGQTFDNETLFADALSDLLGEEDSGEYQGIVLHYSSVDRDSNALHSLLFLESAKAQEPVNQLDAWLSQEQESNFILGAEKDERTSKNAKASKKTHKESWLSKVRGFCDKWGLPRPRTLVLLLFLLYMTGSLTRHFIKSRL